MPSFPTEQTKRLNPNADPYCGGPAHLESSLLKVEYLRSPVTARFQVVSHIISPNGNGQTTAYWQPYPVINLYDATNQCVPRSVLRGSVVGPRFSRKTKNVAGRREVTTWMPKKRVLRPAKNRWSSMKENTAANSEVGNRVNAVIPFPVDHLELERAGITTVMIKNIPNQFGSVSLFLFSLCYSLRICLPYWLVYLKKKISLQMLLVLLAIQILACLFPSCLKPFWCLSDHCLKHGSGKSYSRCLSESYLLLWSLFSHHAWLAKHTYVYFVLSVWVVHDFIHACTCWRYAKLI